jgi:DNA-binding NtrC family response regulator
VLLLWYPEGEEYVANILVIDDEPVLLDLISNTLRLDGHNVTALSSPLAALDAQAVRHPPIDLLLTDISMEPISGHELVRRMSKTGFTGPVLFMSGYPALTADVAEALGECTALEKPFTAVQLRSTVKRVLARCKARAA